MDPLPSPPTTEATPTGLTTPLGPVIALVSAVGVVAVASGIVIVRVRRHREPTVGDRR